MDKYLLPILRLNVFIYNKIFKCGKMVDRGIRDNYCMTLIRQTNLGRFMMRTKRRANTGTGPIK